ncbi:hypothetical protein H2200_005492 [Cladophialophora chaetospira]|uniref:Fungal N-terminal domain-containing protein n=1 Tax=Cladophialophora chaetospira TaxID=386627 RepID=A0AA38XC43_9EURO|nr:hypothetical protein H2200_005492 [Cladophialophora chaetospira]
MSGVEIVGLAASVLQIADLGWKTSYKLYAFSKKIHNAGKTIELVSQDISATGAVLRHFGDEIGKDEKANLDSRLCSQGLISGARKLVEECNELFKEIDHGIGGKGGNEVVLGFKQKLKWSYLEPLIELLRANLERLKSTLALMLNVLMYAEQRSREDQAAILETQTVVASFAAQSADTEEQIVQPRNRIEGKPAVSQDPGLAATAFNSRPTHGMLSQRQTLNASPRATLANESFDRGITDNTPHTSQPPAVDMATAFQGIKSFPDGQRPQQDPITETLYDHIKEVRKGGPLINLLNLEHQRALIEKLLQKVRSRCYSIDQGARNRMHEGVLNLHWMEWSPLRSLYGDHLLQELLAQSPILAQHWHCRLGAVKAAARAGRYLAGDEIAGVESSGTPPSLSTTSDINGQHTEYSVRPRNAPGGPPRPIEQAPSPLDPGPSRHMSRGNSSTVDLLGSLPSNSSPSHHSSGPTESMADVRNADNIRQQERRLHVADRDEGVIRRERPASALLERSTEDVAMVDYFDSRICEEPALDFSDWRLWEPKLSPESHDLEIATDT